MAKDRLILLVVSQSETSHRGIHGPFVQCAIGQNIFQMDFLYILLVIDSDVDSLNPSGSGRYAKSRE